MKLSVVINTKNAETTIEATLKSVKFADEIVVVHMHSTDKTISIAEKYTDKIFSHKDVGYVEPARNYAISKATGDWILVLDADEEVPQELRKVIQGIIKSNEAGEETADCYYIPRQNFIFNKAIEKTGWWPDYVLRFFKKGHIQWSDQIHSVPLTTGVVKELPALTEIAIIHHNYNQVNQFLDRMNKYTSLQAADLVSELDDQNLEADGAFITKKFYSEFLARYFALRGVNEGTHGLALSFLQGFSEMVVAVKAWEAKGFPQSNGEKEEATIAQLNQFKKELSFWIANWQVENNSGLTKLFWKIRRKLYI